MTVPKPPAAPRRPTVLRRHGDERVDDWYWLCERDNPDVRAYLEAENAYAETVLASLPVPRERIYDEIVQRVEETDESAPVPHGAWEYYARTVEGLQYPIWCRRVRGGGEEQVLIDGNVESEGHDFFDLGGLEESPDQSLLAYAVDFTGGERFTLHIRDLTAGADLDDVVDDVYYGIAWADDSATLWYVRPDEAMRPWQVWRHAVGTSPHDDVLVYQDDDDRYFVTVERSRSGRYALVTTASRMSSEVWFVPTADPTADLRIVEPRSRHHEYFVEHHWHAATGDRFFVLTNDGGTARNFRLAVAPVEHPGRDAWREVLAHRDDVRLEHVSAFAGHLVVSERADGLERLRMLRLSDGSERLVETPDPVYTIAVGPNREYDAPALRFEYSSLVLPPSSYDEDFETGERRLVKRQPVPGYDPDVYTSTRLWATAPDGAQVPMSVVHRRGLVLDGSHPALLYGYGAYEACVDPEFRATRLPLLERGFVYAIAHVRGGGEMGRTWYEDGRLDRKRNTFTDFVACAEHLVALGYTSPGRLVARGRSAGGLLMGAVTNMRPDLFAGVVAEVPFVDVLTTMQDPSIPLTVTEWEEWGDPSDPAMYEYMRSYSPYDNVAPVAHPALLVTAGLNDPRVQYWEPAKWVARLRATGAGDRPLLLHTEMEAGHAGPSGRYEAWRDEARSLAFVVDAAGAAARDTEPAGEQNAPT